MDFNDPIFENNEIVDSTGHFNKNKGLAYEPTFDYYVYCYDYLNNDEYDLLEENFTKIPITDEWNWNLELTNCFTDLDSDYDNEIGINGCFNSNIINIENKVIIV